MKALSIAASGMLAQQHRTEVVANNLANMTTTGYQKRRTEFNDLLYKHAPRRPNASSRAGEQVPAGVNLGMGVKMAAVYRINEQGSLKQTTNSLDLAIQGDGFFQVQLPNGEIALTRDGTFQMSDTGQLVTQDGFPVQPGITIPPNAQNITISATGTIQAKIAGNETPTNVGNIQLALFPNPGGLFPVGDNMFLPTERSGNATNVAAGSNGSGTILQGFVESSNVNPIEEIANLIRAEKAYSMNSKVMSTADEMMSTGR